MQLSVLKSTSRTIDPEHFITILKHLRIIASVPGGQERYFFPCVLNRVGEQEDFETNLLPHAIQFECKHCPKGLFGVLITRLMDSGTEERRESILSLKLLESKIFRDHVSFEVSLPGIHDRVSLQLYSTRIETKYFPDLCKDRSRPLGEMCDETRKVIDASIINSLGNLQYNKSNVRPVMCAKCSNPTCDWHPVEKGNVYCKINCALDGSQRIPQRGRWWYNEGSDIL